MPITDEFYIYMSPSGDSLKKLWSESIFVFDTSALLYFYYFSESSRTEIYQKTLNPIKNRLWIPQHALYEYKKNRENTILKPIKEKYEPSFSLNIKSISKSISDIEGKLLNFKDLTKKNDIHPYIEGDINEKFLNNFLDFKTQFEGYEKSVTTEFKQRKNEISSLLENDDVYRYITTNFKIGNEYTFRNIMDLIQQEGEIRYRNQIPPGYDDEKNKIGTQKYGDLIIWKQILSYAKEQKKSMIYITNDTKPDWCYKVKHDSEIRISKPREELIKEFFDYTNSRFWMYTFNQFLYIHKEIFNTAINQEVLDEATLVVSNDEQKYDLEFNTGSTAPAVDFINNNLDKIGKILYIRHSRNMDEIYYFTEITGENGSLKINGGLTSGFSGAGPNGFIRVLASLGINKNIATNYVKGNIDNIHSFEIPANLIYETSNSSSNNGSDVSCPICGNNNWNGAMCMSCGNMYED